MKIVFMGTPDFSVPALEELAKVHQVAAVVTQQDRPKGRGHKMQYTPVKEKALELNIPVYQPEKVKNPEFVDILREINPDVIVVIAFGQILSKEILDLPKYGCINVHASLLPKYRGAAPIQWAILNGDKTTGVTTMYMDEGMDTGDIILKKEVSINDNQTTGELWDELKKIGGDLLVDTLEEIKNGTAPRIKQDKDFSMAPMLSKSMAQINWNTKTAEEIKNLVRGLNPIMGAYTFLKGKKIKFWKVQIIDENEIQVENMNFLKNGTVIISDSKDGIYIKCKDGIIKILEIQGENAKRMTIQEYLRGNPISEFDIFE